MTYLEELDRELRAVGIRGRRLERIHAEFADHLHSDPQAALGSPAEIARQFADELGTSLARGAAHRAFAALAFAGLALLVTFLAVGRLRAFTAYGQHAQSIPTWTTPVLLVSALAAQVSLAAGGLALLRAWQLRGLRVIDAREATVLARRSALGVLSGIVAVACLPVLAVSFPHVGGSSWHTAAWIVTGLAVLVLAATAPALAASIRIRPATGGPAGDLRDDLAPVLPRSVTPLRFALLLAAAIVILVGAAGVITGDPYDGLVRGFADGAACLAGYALLGRYLGIRAEGLPLA